MGSLSHIDDEKNELVKEVHQLARLGVRLVYTPQGVFQYIPFPNPHFQRVRLH